MQEFLYKIFIKPVAFLSVRDIFLILAFALVVDFFWQFLFKYTVVLAGIAHKKINDRLHGYLRVKADRYMDKIGFLERQLEIAEESGSKKKETQILRKMAKLRKKSRDLWAALVDKEKALEPFVSVIIPCHNSEDVLEETLKKIIALDYFNKEIIVVDDGSTDKTYETALKYSDTIRIVRREEASGRKTGAINLGLAFAKGKIVVVIDDDTLVEEGSLGPLVEPLDALDVAACGGNVQVINKNNILTQLQSIEYLTIMQLIKPFQAFFFRAVLIISGSFGAFKKEYLERIGGWDVDVITEDLDLTWKLYRLKKRVLHAEAAICYTDVPNTLKKLIKQRNRWDFGLFETIAKHRSFIFSKRVPALGFGLLPETIFMEILSIAARPLYIALLILSGQAIWSIILLITYFYLVLEIVVIFFTGLLAKDKRFCLKAVYAPVMLFYHQFLAYIRIRALYRFATKKSIEW